MAIHPTAIIEPGAQLGVDVEVGPYAFIGAEVRLGDRSRVGHHSSITGKTEVGPDNEFYPFVAMGGLTQDLKYTAEPTYLRIGARNCFREFITANRGTDPGAATTIGSDNVFLAYCHFAHDCRVGSHCVFSNNATLGGHVVVEDHVTIGGVTAIHQFCRVGKYVMIGGCSKIVQDVPPYFLADGNPAKVRSLNIIGLRRNDFTMDTVRVLRLAHRILYDADLNTSQAIQKIETDLPKTNEVLSILEFIKNSERGIIR